METVFLSGGKSLPNTQGYTIHYYFLLKSSALENHAYCVEFPQENFVSNESNSLSGHTELFNSVYNKALKRFTLTLK